MQYIPRSIEKHIRRNLFKGKMIVIYGPRQVGKTTMIKEITKDIDNIEYYTCDNPGTREMLSFRNDKELGNFVQGKKLIIIDEAQQIENIGITLKLMHDTYPHVQIIASGSSSFELANKIKEPMTGRALEYTLLPLSFSEIANATSIVNAKNMMALALMYGMYPEVLFGNVERKKLLAMIASQYLYKDILKFEGVRKPEVLEKLLKALAVSVGNEVSYQELSNTIDADRKTVEAYIGYLEQAFIIYRVRPYSTNVRSQISKKHKIYFYDVGIRNILLETFSAIEIRTDKGHLWENFVVTERKKMMIAQDDMFARQYFLRTYDGQEVDLIEESEGPTIRGFEIKYQYDKETFKPPAVWKRLFPEKPIDVITRKNFAQFGLEEYEQIS